MFLEKILLFKVEAKGIGMKGMEHMISSPILEERREVYNRQNDKTKSLLDKLSNANPGTYQLNVIKKGRPKISRGDIFALNPFEDIYFYGVVLNAGIDNRTLGEDLYVIGILKKYTVGMNRQVEFKNVENGDLLLRPQIITKTYWSNGMLYNIGLNIAEKISVDYGFYSIASRCFVDEYSEKIADVPKHADDFCLTTMTGISYEINYELIINELSLRDDLKKAFSKQLKKIVDSDCLIEGQAQNSGKVNEMFVFEKENRERCFVTLGEVERYQELFADMQGDAEGNGYDWEAVVRAFLKELYPKEEKRINFDSEAEMFCMYCSDEALMKELSEKLTEMLRSGEIKKYISEADFLSI